MTALKANTAAPPGTEAHDSTWGVFLVFLRLGLTSFGGPVAHLAYFRNEFVDRRRWLTERSYADLVALCQVLPGPASSQVGMALGLSRRGYRGAFAAWAGFTLPSAIVLILFALGLAEHGAAISPGALHGLKVAAVAVVAQAVWTMARTLCTDAPRLALMALSCCIALAAPSVFTQLGVIALAGLAGLLLKPARADGLDVQPHDHHQPQPLAVRISRRAGALWLALFCLLLAGLPLLAAWLPFQALREVSAFFRAGALVFGGGHVVLPLLQAAVVPPGWVANDTFLAGYGAAQAMPGPLFAFAAFLGASMKAGPAGWVGGLICLSAIFAPAFLLVAGVLPFWERLGRAPPMQAALMGINAAVVGLLLAALYHPVWTGAIGQPRDAALALAAYAALTLWRVPPWLVVAGCAAAFWLLPV